MLNRRQFITRGGGVVVTVVLGAACRSNGSGSSATTPSAARTSAATGSSPSTSADRGPTSSAAAATSTTTRSMPSDRILVLVQLNGGNDGLNTIIPLDGRYRDARPALALPENELLAFTGLTGYGLHPSLEPLRSAWGAGRFALLDGIGFPDPNRSHFVAMDRWAGAGDASAAGWLARVLDGLTEDPPPLFATALGSGAPVLLGSQRQATVVLDASAFAFDEDWDSSLIAALATPSSGDAIVAAAQAALARTVDAVGDFAALTGGAPSAATGDPPTREGGATIADGLATAARLITGDVGTRIVVVSAGGFDTHANQLQVQQGLLADLATGLSSFDAEIEAAGLSERVLVAGLSEFGRRVSENGSGGTDHGAGGVAFLLGGGVNGGLHGGVDLGDLLDGDVRPTLDPRTLQTACLDWLGVDAEQILGRRWDEVSLLNG
jgi:uncharacterized protein (DUF1501 family)